MGDDPADESETDRCDAENLSRFEIHYGAQTFMPRAVAGRARILSFQA